MKRGVIMAYNVLLVWQTWELNREKMKDADRLDVKKNLRINEKASLEFVEIRFLT